MRGIVDLGRSAAGWTKTFIAAKRGSAAMIFALTSVALISAGGAGIDMARAIMVKARLSNALDAAALAVGTTSGLSNNQLQTMAQQYFDANYPSTDLGSHNPVVVSVSGQQVSLSVTGSVPTTLLEVVGIDQLSLSVTNEVVRAVTKLRVALVLDNTGSMSQTDNTGTSKISALKTATHQLLTQLQNAAVNPGDVQVSIVPFALDVNDATADPTSDWIDWTDFDAAPPNAGAIGSSVGPGSNCPFSTGTKGYGCLNLSSSKIPSSGTNKGRIYPGTDNGSFNSGRGGHHYNGYYDSVKNLPAGCTNNCTGYSHTWHPTGHAAWTGCFMDRTQSYDANNTLPNTGTPATLFPAEINDYCPPVALTGLTFDWTSLSNKVDQMTPNGSTNQTIGLAWGWQALSQGNPLNAPAQDPTIQNVIVLLSDGLNTQDRWYGDGSNQSTNVDNRMAAACANAKAANIRIYTVLVMSGNSTVLQNCASDPQKYFSLNTAGAVVTAFNSIGTELANLHLAR